MVRRPKVFDRVATVAAIRSFFLDDHVHMAVIVGSDGRLLTTVERADLNDGMADDTLVIAVGGLDGRTTAPACSLTSAWEAMLSSGRRRLAVVDASGVLLGLLCLKQSGRGFCSDLDISLRRSRPDEAQGDADAGY